ncbi:hypothetical protein V5799_010419 [Amblyomma americanum]|uniref:M13 family peptidase n=1 Tax=Amblyomma americanum TaxID=6943 RepID=A0AAQ4EKB5_AMBAM
MLVIYPGSLIEHFTVSEQTGAAFGEYLRHHLARGFGNATDVIAAFPAFRKQVEQATAVLNEPLNSTKYPWLRFTFGEIEEHAPNIDSAHWTTTVNRHFAAYSVRFRNDSIVFVTDRRVLQALNSLMRTGRPAFRLPVTAYIAWKFVELFGWVLDDKISEIRFGETDKQLLQEARRVACASFVERTFAFAMSARYLFDSVEGITRGLVSSLITSIQDAMLDFTDNSDWMDPKTKGDFKLRVSDIERTIWITGISAYPGKLTALYSHFPVMIHNFVVNWIESNRALSRRLVSLLADESSATSESDRRTAYAEYRANSDPSQSLYLYHLNSMIMPMSLLFKPMYVPEGTQAMNYAGFGALYSQLQIKLLDTVGIQFNENRQLASWMTASPMARYDAKVRCFFSRESQVDLWERLAFQVVLKAFQQSKSEAHAHGIRLQGLEEFSDDAVFYMSYCYISCARTAAKTRVVRRSHVCNAIIDTEHFRKTFNCPPRPLNQQNECPRFW